MGKASDWGNETEFQKTNIVFPRRIWEGAKTQAMKEGRTLQELVSEAVAAYLARTKGKKGAGR